MTKTVIPADPDDLFCDTCTDRYPSKGTPLRTSEMARVSGWRVWQGVILCPDCTGTPRSKVPIPKVLPGQVDLLEELGIIAHHVPKGKSKRAEEAS